MTYEYYAALHSGHAGSPGGGVWNLASGYVDRAAVDATGDAPNAKTEARKDYREQINQQPQIKDIYRSSRQLYPEAQGQLLHNWLFLAVDFELVSPWYSKDDRPFHVLDNPVRKDRVFGVPFMAAASWKGLLRWTCRMDEGLLEHLAEHDSCMADWKEPDWIVHLFGNERDEGTEFSQGALRFFPTWFDQLGFEVINPHSRETRAGTQPIVYEVVPAGTAGVLQLRYAPDPGPGGPSEAMPKLVDAIEKLLTVYGFSAKRTAGWGAATVKACTVRFSEKSEWSTRIGSGDIRSYEPPSEASATLMDEHGHPLATLITEDDTLISKRAFGKLGNDKPSCTNRQFDEFKAWYVEYGEIHSRHLNRDDERKAPAMRERKLESLGKLSDALREGVLPQNEGDQ